MKTNFEEKVYEIDETWDIDWFSNDDEIRINKLTKLIAKLSPSNLVDVGCGNGLLLNHIKESCIIDPDSLLGVERSSSAIKHVKTKKIQASIDEIPLENNSFDLVTCCEVIEHLPIDIYEKGLRELARVARKFILVSVPYNEDLVKNLNVCPKCQTRFNPEYHVRSFNEGTIMALFDEMDFKIVETGFIEVEKFKFSNLIGFLRNGNKPTPIASHTICPMCGYNENYKIKQQEKNKIEPIKKLSFLEVIKNVWPRKTRKRWIYGVYQKVE